LCASGQAGTARGEGDSNNNKGDNVSDVVSYDLNNAQTVAKAEKVREGCPRVRATPASQPPKTEENTEGGEDEEILPCIPRSFDFEDHGGGAALGAGAGTINPFNAVGVLGNL